MYFHICPSTSVTSVLIVCTCVCMYMSVPDIEGALLIGTEGSWSGTHTVVHHLLSQVMNLGLKAPVLWEHRHKQTPSCQHITAIDLYTRYFLMHSHLRQSALQMGEPYTQCSRCLEAENWDRYTWVFLEFVLKTQYCRDVAPVRIDAGHQYTVLLNVSSDSSSVLLCLPKVKPTSQYSQTEKEMDRERTRGRERVLYRYRASVKIGESLATVVQLAKHCFSLWLNYTITHTNKDRWEFLFSLCISLEHILSPEHHTISYFPLKSVKCCKKYPSDNGFILYMSIAYRLKKKSHTRQD